MGTSEAARQLADLGVDAVSVALLYHGGQILSLAGDEPEFIFPPAGRPLWSLNPDQLPGALRGRALVPFLQELRAMLMTQGILLRAWTVAFHDAVGLTPITNAVGQALVHAPCPVANRGYLRSVVEGVASLGVVDAVELEAAGFMLALHGAHHEIAGVQVTHVPQLLLGLCFCAACQRMMLHGNLDAALVQHTVRTDLSRMLERDVPVPTLDAYLQDHPDVSRLLHVREEAVAAGVSEAVTAFPGPVGVIAPSRHAPARLATLEGLNPGAIRKAVPQDNLEWVTLAYGDPGAGPQDVQEALDAGFAPDQVIAGVTLIEAADASLEAIQARIQALSVAGAQRFSLYNFGILSPERRRYIQAIAQRVHRRI